MIIILVTISVYIINLRNYSIYTGQYIWCDLKTPILQILDFYHQNMRVFLDEFMM